MNKRKLRKQLEKYYWANSQHIIIDTWEVMENNDNDCGFDVHLADSDVFLFTVQNYEIFNDIAITHKEYFKEHKIIEIWDGVKASCTPFYIDQTFTFKKFTKITKEDMIGCTKYFLNEIFGLWGLFNIKFKENK